jgi:hypothetical protein
MPTDLTYQSLEYNKDFHRHARELITKKILVLFIAKNKSLSPSYLYIY